MSRPFVFVDRDGTLVEDRGYVFRIEDYAPLPRAAEGLCLLQEAGYGLAIVTNQSGIGRGYYTRVDFDRFQAHLLADLAARGVRIEATFHCPHLPDADCACRKPRTGMLERARAELAADLRASWVIGDQLSDVELAANAGCRAVYVRSDAREVIAAELQVAADLPVAADLVEAAHAILSAPSPSPP